MIYNAAKVRRLPTKFQVDTCKPKKGKNSACAVAQAMIYNAVRSLSTKFQAIHVKP